MPLLEWVLLLLLLLPVVGPLLQAAQPQLLLLVLMLLVEQRPGAEHLPRPQQYLLAGEQQQPQRGQRQAKPAAKGETRLSAMMSIWNVIWPENRRTTFRDRAQYIVAFSLGGRSRS